MTPAALDALAVGRQAVDAAAVRHARLSDALDADAADLDAARRLVRRLVESVDALDRDALAVGALDLDARRRLVARRADWSGAYAATDAAARLLADAVRLADTGAALDLDGGALGARVARADWRAGAARLLVRLADAAARRRVRAAALAVGQ